MEGIAYIGEHLWIGQLGQLLIFLAFSTAILATISFAAGTNATPVLSDKAPTNWRKIGRLAFLTHGLSIISIIGLIFYMMINKYYEYEYVWAHVSNSLPFRYVFSAFWEGQEGSFLLWMFWNCILGFALMKTAKKWEMPVMAVFSFIQVFFVFFLLGLYVGDDVRIGASPFMLLRNAHFAPIFNTPNYLTQIEGTGLNPLLQNYWMTIHPPTLFLGFASTLVPCAFAVAGLWKKEHRAWMQPALKWGLFSGAILGTGILMGGVWAYEALSFGGYWAWDPVENASLVPWITLVAGIHTTLVARSTGYSIKSSYIFYILTFFLIVYSTFLTRSGILGETSVHAFTEMGLEWQLVIFLGVIGLGSIGLYWFRSREIPTPEREESVYSKEFWMFVGSLVMLFSAGLITATTSIPVWNALLNPIYELFGKTRVNIAPPEDVVAHHNNFQLWIGVLVAILSGFSQFMLYKKDEMTGERLKQFLISVGSCFALAVIGMYAVMKPSGIQAWQYWLLVGTAIFTILTNLIHLFKAFSGNVKVSSSAISHIGFGLMLIGVVFSGALKYPLFDEFGQIEGILGDLNKQTSKNTLVPLGQTVALNDGFSVTYTKNWTEGNAQNFELSFLRKDKEGNIIDRFVTTPNVLLDSLPNGSLKFSAANPDTKHYLHRDVFTLAVPNWAFLDPVEEAKNDTSKWMAKHVAVGDTFYTRQNYIVYKGNESTVPEDSDDYIYQQGDVPVTAILQVFSLSSGASETIRTIYYIRDRQQFNVPVTVEKLGLSVRLLTMVPEEGKMVFEVKDKTPKSNYVVVQAIIFPGINLVWLGCIMMMGGLFIGMLQRIAQKRKQQANA